MLNTVSQIMLDIQNNVVSLTELLIIILTISAVSLFALAVVDAKLKMMRKSMRSSTRRY